MTLPMPQQGSSRREFIVFGSKAAAGMGIAALLGNLGNWALSYAQPMSRDVCLAKIPSAIDQAPLGVQKSYTWPKGGYELHIRFLNGKPALHAEVEAIAKEWTEYANIRLIFDNDRRSKIRIIFGSAGPSGSAIGTACELISVNEPTMYLGSTDTRLRQVVLHEFGHALGCLHEHMSPEAGIQWNVPAVYEYYSRFGWSKQEVDDNILKVFDKSQTNFSEFDQKSIMIYPIPRELTLNGFEVDWNNELSETDKSWIRKMYP